MIIKMAAKPKKFILVQWLEEETLSVLTSTSVRQEQKSYVGALGDFKWGGNFFEGEVFSLSGKSYS